jgi:hypothetical protein
VTEHSTRRRLVLAVATLLAALAAATQPAAAADSPSPDQQCAANAPSDAMCTGVDKVGERGSAECRRASDATGGPISDEQCYPPIGHQVNRQAVDDYGTSWVHRALQFQYRLANDVPFRNAPWLGTHNSFNSTSEFPTLSHTDANQQLSLADQLDLDMRSLELDVHWFPSAEAGGQQAPVVCHARPPSEGNAGCTSERLLSDRLPEISSWLNRPENRHEVLLLYLEDAVANAAGYEATNSVLNEKLKRLDGSSLIYHPHPSGTTCEKLPMDVSRDDVLAAGAQVVIVSGCGAGWAGNVFDWNGGGPEVESGSSSGYGSFPDCDTRFNRETYDTKMVRYFEDSTWLSAATDPSAPPGGDDKLSADKVGRMIRCGVDLFGMDQLLPDDGRLEALVWSWAPDQHQAGAGECAAQRGDGRWVSQPCGESRRAACRRGDGAWMLTGAVPYEDAAQACANAGAVFDVPRTGYENSQLRAVAGADEAWLHYGYPVAAGGATGGETGPSRPAPPGLFAAPPRGPRAAGAKCRVERAGRAKRGAKPKRQKVTCAVVPGAPATVSAKLSRRGVTYARARRRLSSKGGTLVLSPSRALKPGSYNVKISIGGRDASASLARTVRIR